MPWTANSIFEVRRNFALLALSPKSNIRRLCKQFNISPNTGYQTLERYRAEGENGLRVSFAGPSPDTVALFQSSVKKVDFRLDW